MPHLVNHNYKWTHILLVMRLFNKVCAMVNFSKLYGREHAFKQLFEHGIFSNMGSRPILPPSFMHLKLFSTQNFSFFLKGHPHASTT